MSPGNLPIASRAASSRYLASSWSIWRQRSAELVAGDLFADQTVVRLVVVEGPDQIVAVVPGLGPQLIDPVAVGVGVADQVEPVLGPSLAVSGRGEQAVDQRLVGVGRGVGEEG